MDSILLWFWTGVFAATVLWWLIMLICVAFIGPGELRAMFRTLKQSHTDESTAESNHAA
jgi:hypothetical protein